MKAFRGQSVLLQYYDHEWLVPQKDVRLTIEDSVRGMEDLRVLT